MKKKQKRSLYQCFHAKVKGDIIYCKKGHQLHPHNVYLLRLIRGSPLELEVCQSCEDYDKMGPPVPPAERGWEGKVQE